MAIKKKKKKKKTAEKRRPETPAMEVLLLNSIKELSSQPDSPPLD